MNAMQEDSDGGDENTQPAGTDNPNSGRYKDPGQRISEHVENSLIWHKHRIEELQKRVNDLEKTNIGMLTTW